MVRYAVVIVTAALVIGGFLLLVNNIRPHDDTDPPGSRSGLGLMTDHSTGCQYLYYRSTLTPRMDKDGKQICVETVK